MDPAIQLLLTHVDTPETAARIAAAVVGEQLAACVNIQPGVQSVYRWQGAVETAAETAMVLKTSASRMPALMDRVRALHPYELPELVVVDVVSGLPGYLDWVRSSCQVAGGTPV